MKEQVFKLITCNHETASSGEAGWLLKWFLHFIKPQTLKWIISKDRRCWEDDERFPSVLVFWSEWLFIFVKLLLSLFFPLPSDLPTRPPPLNWGTASQLQRSTWTSGKNKNKSTKTSFSNCVTLTPGSLTFWLQRTVYNLYLDMHMWIFDDHLMCCFFCLYFLFFLWFVNLFKIWNKDLY